MRCVCSDASEKERTRALTREKLEARRRRRAQHGGADTAAEVAEEERQREAEEARRAEESVGVHEDVSLVSAVMTEVEAKLARERDKMADLLNQASALPTIQTWIQNMKSDVSSCIQFPHVHVLARMKDEFAQSVVRFCCHKKKVFV